jgi:hypothetical protein
MKSLFRLFADFNNADQLGRVRLNTVESLKDLEKFNIKPRMKVLLDNHEGLCTIGIIEFSKGENILVAKIDWDSFPNDGG